MEEEGGRQEVVERAGAFAWQAHANTFRRGDKWPETSPLFGLGGAGHRARQGQVPGARHCAGNVPRNNFIQSSQPLCEGSTVISTDGGTEAQQLKNQAGIIQ